MGNSRRCLSNKPESTLDVPTLVTLFVLEASFVILFTALYKKGDRPLVDFFASRAGVLGLIALAGLLGALVFVVARLRLGLDDRVERLRRTAAVNLLSVAAILGTSELLIRTISVRTSGVTTFMGVRLLPRDWHEVAAHNRKVLTEARLVGSYLVFDRMLGWDVGQSRSSVNGLYFSSAEGIRSSRSGETFAKSPAKSRVALVGDSYTFGLEVSYEDSWGHQLERELGEDVQVLNFGVNGYGVDQAYLKYCQRVRAWHPDVVIFGVVDHDLERTMGVYAFLTFPESDLSFPKPRMVFDRQGRLAALNVPLLRPEDIFSTPMIGRLPFIDFDLRYDAWEWEWHWYHLSYLVRFLQSRFPRWQVTTPEVSDNEMARVNEELIRSFVRVALDDGAIPVLVYLPGQTRFRELASSIKEGPAQKLLDAAHVPYVDMTPCVERVEEGDRFVTRHYSRIASTAIARCLRDVVRERLALYHNTPPERVAGAAPIRATLQALLHKRKD